MVQDETIETKVKKRLEELTFPRLIAQVIFRIAGAGRLVGVAPFFFWSFFRLILGPNSVKYQIAA